MGAEECSGSLDDGVSDEVAAEVEDCTGLLDGGGSDEEAVDVGDCSASLDDKEFDFDMGCCEGAWDDGREDT